MDYTKSYSRKCSKIVPANSIMIGTRVGIGKVAINTVEMSTSQDVISLINIDEDKWYKPYLCKLLLSKRITLIHKHGERQLKESR